MAVTGFLFTNEPGVAARFVFIATPYVRTLTNFRA